MEILETARAFDLPTEPVSFRECRVGHINSTFFLFDGAGRGYVLQKINTHVFRDPEGLMENVFAVTDHIRGVLARTGGDAERGTLRFRKTADGRLFFTDPEGRAWRLYDMIDGAYSMESADPATFMHVGTAFGRFQRQLADFDASSLRETIPFFHDTVRRFGTFRKSLGADPAGRAASVGAEIDFAMAHEGICSYVTSRLDAGLIPSRVTHNDTKLNNILMDEKTRMPLCVIDLDTIMPGSVLYDFGDAIRFGASSAAEDETDLSKVFFRHDMFESFTRGFLRALGGELCSEELASLPMGALVITFETGLRFLTDHIDGDVYFRTSYPGQNLDRARNQFRLVADLESRMPLFLDTVEKIAKE
jgi:hypothetical protein